MSYDEFRLEISATGTGGRYRLRAESPWSTDPVFGEFSMPYEPDALVEIREKVEAAIYGSGAQDWGGSQESVVRDFGARLYDSVFGGEIGEFFGNTINRSTEELRRVRVRLVTDVPELISLPWECLYGRGDWLVRSPDICLVRHVPTNIGGRGRAKVSEPLRVLGMVAHPSDRDDIDGVNERNRIEQALSNVDSNRLSLHWTKDGTWPSLQEAMAEVRPHVFHFIGHGRYNERRGIGTLAFEREPGGETQFIDSEQLKLLIKGNKDLRLVVLNACEGAKGDSRIGLSNTAAYLVQETADAVLAMQWEISDSAASQFAETFYRSLANDGAVDNSLDQARVGMFMDDKSLEWAAPVLYMRSKDGVLFSPEPVEGQDDARSSNQMKPLLDPVPVLAEPVSNPEGSGAATDSADQESGDSEPDNSNIQALPTINSLRSQGADAEGLGSESEPFVIRFNEVAGEGRYRLSTALDANDSPVEDEIELNPDSLDRLLWAGASSVPGPVRLADGAAGEESSLIPLASAAETVGKQLEESLTATAVGRHLLEMLRGLDTQNPDQVMRLIIDTTEANDLARLPWEFLWNDQRGQHAVLDRQTPVLRQLDFGVRPSSPPEDLPLRLLVASAEVVEQPELKVAEEFAGLSDELRGLEADGLVEIERLDHATIDSLSDALEAQRSHILHFIGHGDFKDGEGVLALESAEVPGTTDLAFADDLFVRFGNQLTHLQMVFLNSCMGATVSAKDPFSGIAQQMIKRGVPSVIAMQFPIPDVAAAKLSSEFYRYLADGDPIDVALSRARARLYRKNRPASWGAPALYMRPWEGPLALVSPDDPNPVPVAVEATAPPSVAAPQPSTAGRVAAAAGAAGAAGVAAARAIADEGATLKASGPGAPRSGDSVTRSDAEPWKGRLPLLLGTAAVLLFAVLFGTGLFGSSSSDEEVATPEPTTAGSQTESTGPDGPVVTEDDATTSTISTTTSSQATTTSVQATTPPTTVDQDDEDVDEVSVGVAANAAAEDYDVYVGGELVDPGQPVELEPGTVEVEVFESSAAAPTDVDERTDAPAASVTVPVEEVEATIVVQANAGTEPDIAVVDRAVEPFAPGTGRIDVRHEATGADLQVTLKPGGRATSLPAGDAAFIPAGVGSYRLEVVDPATGLIKSIPVSVADGELVTISLGGVVADGLTVTIDRVTGLDRSPDGVPSGNSGLLAAQVSFGHASVPAFAPVPRNALTLGEAERSSGSIGFSGLGRPVSISLDGVAEDAPVSAAGVDAANQFEVPPVDQVGWYRFGSVPGQAGSTVLAAHVDFGGEHGVFFNLHWASIGDVVELTLDDGTVAAYRITESELFERPDVPLGDLFTKGGDDVLHLITCGGEFDEDAGSYESNLVVTAVPVTPESP